MVLRLLLFLFILISSNTFSQNAIRIFYDVKTKLNIEKDTLLPNIYVLDIYPNKKISYFYNRNYIITDSVMNNVKTMSDRGQPVYLDFDTDLKKQTGILESLIKKTNLMS